MFARPTQRGGVQQVVVGEREVAAHHERVAEEDVKPAIHGLMNSATVPRRRQAAFRLARAVGRLRHRVGPAGRCHLTEPDCRSRLLQLGVDLLVDVLQAAGEVLGVACLLRVDERREGVLVASRRCDRGRRVFGFLKIFRNMLKFAGSSAPMRRAARRGHVQDPVGECRLGDVVRRQVLHELPRLLLVLGRLRDADDAARRVAAAESPCGPSRRPGSGRRRTAARVLPEMNETRHSPSMFIATFARLECVGRSELVAGARPGSEPGFESPYQLIRLFPTACTSSSPGSSRVRLAVRVAATSPRTRVLVGGGILVPAAGRIEADHLQRPVLVPLGQLLRILGELVDRLRRGSGCRPSRGAPCCSTGPGVREHRERARMPRSACSSAPRTGTGLG